VVLWGPGLPVEDIAARAGTITYELLCNVSQRVDLEIT
jgi:alanine racemase